MGTGMTANPEIHCRRFATGDLHIFINPYDRRLALLKFPLRLFSVPHPSEPKIHVRIQMYGTCLTSSCASPMAHSGAKTRSHHWTHCWKRSRTLTTCLALSTAHTNNHTIGTDLKDSQKQTMATSLLLHLRLAHDFGNIRSSL